MKQPGGLGDRLRAYNKSKPAAPQILRGTHFEFKTEIFTTHPLSNEALALPDKVVLDFRRDEDSARLMFFDLESTGLGSAEQVYPFLIGFAKSSGEASELTTLFAATPAGEEDILRAFIAAAENSVLVSFNGKSFDLPLIIRRASKYGLKHNLASLPHVDLYHLIRRIYPEKPARLIDAEMRLLNFSRAGDLGGAEVAQAYFELLRFGDQGLKAKVLLHNAWDVLTLVSLMQRVSTAFELARKGELPWAYKIHRDKSAAPAEQKKLLEGKDLTRDARDLYTLARILRGEKDYLRAARKFAESYRAGHSPAIVDTIRTLARLGKMKSATGLARYAVAREDERIQRQLVRYL